MDPAPSASLGEPPREVTSRFSERVEPGPSSLEVLDARGRRVHLGEATVDPADPWRYRVAVSPLAPGAYTVSWRVLSADDGHVTHGAHVFTVGALGAVEAAAARSAPTVQTGAGWRPLARWLVATGGALLLGIVVAGPLLGLGAAGGPAKLAVLGGLAVAVGATLDLVLQARELAGPRSLAGVLSPLFVTAPGRVWLLRLGLLLLLALLALRRAPLGGSGRWGLRAGLAAAVVATGGLVSHGAAVVEGRWVVLGAQALHLLAMASWAGGLLGFATVFWRAEPARTMGPAARLALAIPAFSGLALLAVGSLAVSGLVLARVHLTQWGELVATPYGRWLAAKLAVFVAMLLLGAWHQMWVQPRLVRLVERGEPTPGPIPRFRCTVRVEAALGVVALGLAGFLGVTPPPAPRAPAEAPPSAALRHERALDVARVRLEIAPLRPGPNTIRLTVTDPAGHPLRDATAAMVQVTPIDAGVGAVTFQLDPAGPGEFVAPAAVLGLVGRWSGRLVVQRSGAYDVNDRFELTVAEGAATHVHGEPAAPARGAVPLDRVTLGAALAAAAITLPLFLRSRHRLRAVRRLLADTPQTPASTPASR
jgi:copper transport protein